MILWVRERAEPKRAARRKNVSERLANAEYELANARKLTNMDGAAFVKLGLARLKCLLGERFG